MPLKDHSAHILELPQELWESLERLNAECGKDQTPRLLEAMGEFLDDELTFIGHLKKSIEQADRGEFASSEEVVAVFAKYAC